MFLTRDLYKLKKTFHNAQLTSKHIKSFLVVMNQATHLAACPNPASGCTCAAETTMAVNLLHIRYTSALHCATSDALPSLCQK